MKLRRPDTIVQEDKALAHALKWQALSELMYQQQGTTISVNRLNSMMLCARGCDV